MGVGHKLRVALAIAVISLTGCEKEPVSTVYAGNGAQVGKLFTVDGCSVYRFSDGGNNVYFTNCSGGTQWTQNCGKNCTRKVNVPTGREDDLP